MAKEMLVNVSEGEECRIALLDNGKLEELYMERTSSTSHVGNIYKGRVTNVEPSIQAAFVDFGLGRNGFLHISDLMPTYFGRAGDDIQESVGRKMSRRDRPPIQRCLRRGDDIIVQIIKEGIGTKGPTLSTYLSIPGRILVMMPGMAKFGISKKIEDEDERRRLRGILDGLKPIDEVGFIIRTAGVGKTKTEIQRDLTYLTRLWQNINKQMKEKAPVELYTEGDLIARTVRDVFTSDVTQIVVDNDEVAKKIKDFIKILMPRTKNRVELFEEPVPIFHKYGIEKEIELMYSRHVPLPSGGSLVIDSTEAVVAIDVNSGKFRDHSDAETTAFRTDMEAADEIPRQLRLRDLGGVIICDFIDLRFERHRRELEKRLHDNLRNDRAKTKVLRMSQFGIIEMTRQRMRPSLKRSIYSDCPHCKGAGLVKTPESMSLDVMRRLAIAANDLKVARIELRVCPDVAFYLLNKKRVQLAELETQTKKRIMVGQDASLSLDEMKLELFDVREGMVYLDELGMRPQESIGAAGHRPTTSRRDSSRRDGGGRESGGRDAGGRDAGGRDAGGRDSGSKSSGARDSGGRDSRSRDSGRGSEVGERNSAEGESGDRDTGGSHAGGRDARGRDAGGRDAGGRDAGGRDGGGGGRPSQGRNDLRRDQRPDARRDANADPQSDESEIDEDRLEIHSETDEAEGASPSEAGAPQAPPASTTKNKKLPRGRSPRPPESPEDTDDEEESSVIDIDDAAEPMGEGPRAFEEDDDNSRHRRGRRGGRNRGGDRGGADRGGQRGPARNSDRGNAQSNPRANAPAQNRDGANEEHARNARDNDERGSNERGSTQRPNNQRARNERPPGQPADDQGQNDDRLDQDQDSIEPGNRRDEPRGNNRNPRGQQRQPNQPSGRSQSGRPPQGGRGQPRGAQPSRPQPQRDATNPPPADAVDPNDPADPLEESAEAVGPGNEAPASEQEGDQPRKRRRRRGGRRHRRRRERAEAAMGSGEEGSTAGGENLNEEDAANIANDESDEEGDEERSENSSVQASGRDEAEAVDESRRDQAKDAEETADKDSGARDSTRPEPAQQSPKPAEPRSRGAASQAAPRRPAPARVPPPVVRTGSTDRHIVDDEPIDSPPPSRPRTYQDLDDLPDDLD